DLRAELRRRRREYRGQNRGHIAGGDRGAYADLYALGRALLLLRRAIRAWARRPWPQPGMHRWEMFFEAKRVARGLEWIVSEMTIPSLDCLMLGGVRTYLLDLRAEERDLRAAETDSPITVTFTEPTP